MAIKEIITTFAVDYQGVPTSVGSDDTLEPDLDDTSVGMY